MITEFEYPIKKPSKEVQDFLDNGGKVTVITPEQTAETLAKQNGGYYKGFNNSWSTNKKSEDS
jgi:hypothetical protein|tara:strand:+ start:165 stop:353 length:189 start_codon:yes stop_codon:yes gene_type:complete